MSSIIQSKIGEKRREQTQFAVDLEMFDVVGVVMAFALVKADSKSKGLDAQKENSSRIL